MLISPHVKGLLGAVKGADGYALLCTWSCPSPHPKTPVIAMRTARSVTAIFRAMILAVPSDRYKPGDGKN